MTYYNHSANLTNPAKASAIAKAARELVSEKKAYRVEFTSFEGKTFYWEGDYNTALSIANEMYWNSTEAKMFNPKGYKVDFRNERY